MQSLLLIIAGSVYITLGFPASTENMNPVNNGINAAVVGDKTICNVGYVYSHGGVCKLPTGTPPSSASQGLTPFHAQVKSSLKKYNEEGKTLEGYNINALLQGDDNDHSILHQRNVVAALLDYRSSKNKTPAPKATTATQLHLLHLVSPLHLLHHPQIQQLHFHRLPPRLYGLQPVRHPLHRQQIMQLRALTVKPTRVYMIKVILWHPGECVRSPTPQKPISPVP
jgi:hypothetical protein